VIKIDYVTVSVRIPREMYKALLDEARKKLVSVSDVIRQALLEYLEHLEHQGG